MEMVKATGFAELSENEIQEVDGGSINWAMAFMLGGINLIVNRPHTSGAF